VIRPTIVAIAAAATIQCFSPGPDRAAQLSSCQLISGDGDALARCLVMKYDWPADTAGPAKLAWQWHLDSIRADHEAQAAAVLAAQLERERQLAEAAQARERHYMAIDSAYWVCYGPVSLHFIAHGGPELRAAGEARCLAARDSALRRAGLPRDREPN